MLGRKPFQWPTQQVDIDSLIKESAKVLLCVDNFGIGRLLEYGQNIFKLQQRYVLETFDMNERLIHNVSLALTTLALILCFMLASPQRSILASQAGEAISVSGTPVYKSVNGTSIGGRVVDVTSYYPRIEDSFVENATITGVGSVQNIGTYEDTKLSSNVSRGTGQGIISSIESGNIVTWNAYDLGHRQDKGTYVFTGMIFFDIPQSARGHESNEFSFLDHKAGIYRSTIGDNGSTREIWLLQ
jgi:hypothetical protein